MTDDISSRRTRLENARNVALGLRAETDDEELQAQIGMALHVLDIAAATLNRIDGVGPVHFVTIDSMLTRADDTLSAVSKSLHG